MGWSFRKSIRVGKHFRINLSKSGVGFSTGVKGFRVGVGPKGVTRTVSIPGTGIYNRKTTSLHKASVGSGSSGGENSYTASNNAIGFPDPGFTPEKWYRKTGWIIFFLIFFAPVGLFLMWRYKKWPVGAKSVVSGVFGLWFVLWVIGFSTKPSNSSLAAVSASSNLSGSSEIFPSIAQSSSSSAVTVVVPPAASKASSASSTPSSSSSVPAAAVTSKPASSSSSSAPAAAAPKASKPAVAPSSSAIKARLAVTQEPGAVSPGDYATVSIKGSPNTEYTCTVTYKSGPSSAEGLGSTMSDSSGNASWTWKVGTRTSSGSWPVDISGGGESVETSVTVD